MENFECLCVGFERNQDGAFVMATSGNMVLFRRYCCVRIYKGSLCYR